MFPIEHENVIECVMFINNDNGKKQIGTSDYARKFLAINNTSTNNNNQEETKQTIAVENSNNSNATNLFNNILKTAQDKN